MSGRSRRGPTPPTSGGSNRTRSGTANGTSPSRPGPWSAPTTRARRGAIGCQVRAATPTNSGSIPRLAGCTVPRATATRGRPTAAIRGRTRKRASGNATAGASRSIPPLLRCACSRPRSQRHAPTGEGSHPFIEPPATAGSGSTRPRLGRLVPRGRPRGRLRHILRPVEPWTVPERRRRRDLDTGRRGRAAPGRAAG